MGEEEKFIRDKIEECTRLIEASSWIGNKKAYAKERTQFKCVLARIQKLQKENSDAKEEVEKKDKMIELMAEHIVSSAIVDDTVCAIKCDCDIDEDCSHEKMLKCTKQYFENKAEKLSSINTIQEEK